MEWIVVLWLTVSGWMKQGSELLYHDWQWVDEWNNGVNCCDWQWVDEWNNGVNYSIDSQYSIVLSIHLTCCYSRQAEHCMTQKARHILRETQAPVTHQPTLHQKWSLLPCRDKKNPVTTWRSQCSGMGCCRHWESLSPHCKSIMVLRNIRNTNHHVQQHCSDNLPSPPLPATFILVIFKYYSKCMEYVTCALWLVYVICIYDLWLVYVTCDLYMWL
jgi:hypothetical protein